MQVASIGVPLLAFLRPGDILLYSSQGFVAWWIKTKTSDDVSHAGWYLGDGRSAEARGPQDESGGGVHTFPLRTRDLTYILRPNVPFDLSRMRAFHASCIGQKYALWDLVKVYYLRKQGDPSKTNCSEKVARDYRIENGGPGLFNPHFDCDKVTPAMLKLSPHVDLFVVKGGEVFDVAEDRGGVSSGGRAVGLALGPA